MPHCPPAISTASLCKGLPPQFPTYCCRRLNGPSSPLSGGNKENLPPKDTKKHHPGEGGGGGLHWERRELLKTPWRRIPHTQFMQQQAGLQCNWQDAVKPGGEEVCKTTRQCNANKRWQCKWVRGGGQVGGLVGDGGRHSTANEEAAMQTRECNTSEEYNLTRWCDAISEGTAMQTRACDSAGSACNGRRGCMQWRARLEKQMKKRERGEVLLPNIPHSTPRGNHSMTQEITFLCPAPPPLPLPPAYP